MHNIIDIIFDFEFGMLDDRHMTVSIECDNVVITADPTNTTVKLSKVKIPNQIKIKFFGKNSKTDTKVDQAGNITQDMFVKIIGIRFEHLKVPDWVLHKKLTYTTTEGNTLTTAYIGFNGTMVIDIPEANIFSLYRRLNKNE